MAKSKKIQVTLFKSRFGRLPTHMATIKGLGLKKINQSVELDDTKEIRGMVNKISYLVKVKEIS